VSSHLANLGNICSFIDLPFSQYQRIITGEKPKASKADLNSFFLSAGT